MDLQTLHIFHVTAKAGNITRAAEELNCSQPNISVRLQQLETSLGSALFKRHSKGVSLTDKGNILYEYTTNIFSLVEQAENEVTEYSSTKLRIGAPETVLGKMWALLLKSFHNIFPKIEIIINTYPDCELLAKLSTGDLDIGFVYKKPDNENLETLYKYTDNLVIASSSASVCPTESMLKYSTLFLPPDAELYLPEAVKYANKKNVKVLSSLSCVINSVAAGIGYSILPSAAVDTYKQAAPIMVYNMLNGSPSASIRLVRCKNHKNKMYVDKFTEIVKTFTE